MRLLFSNSHVFWTYETKSQKALVPLNYPHPKLVKNGMQSSFFLAALDEYCPYLMRASFIKGATRLMETGFNPKLTASVAERLLKKTDPPPIRSIRPYMRTVFP